MFLSRNTHFCILFLISIINCAELETCPEVPKLTVLPGLGWDALTNNNTKQLIQLTYNQCKLTSDGKFLIPDNAIEVEVHEEDKHVEAEIFEHWSHYTAPTSTGFKVATDIWPKQFLPLYYSFSNEYQQVKRLQVKNKAYTCRTQLRQVFYRINTTSNDTMVYAAKERFQQMIAAFSENDVEQAKYIAKMIVSDYGTHYTKSVDVGAAFVREDYLRPYFVEVNNEERSNVLSAAKLSLLEYTGYSWNNKQHLNNSLLTDYNDAIREKKIRFFGGLNWEKDTIAECLVVVDRSGDLLSSLLTASNFPGAQSSLLISVKKMFIKVIQEYYLRNIHRGCTRPRSSNFEYTANLDDDSCESTEVSNYVFGGFFARVKEVYTYGLGDDWSSVNLANPLTLGYTCPTKFEASIVYSRISFRTHTNGQYHAFVKQELVSCLANESLGMNYLFGGLYSPDVDNIQTKSKSCPPFYKAITVNAQLGSLSICINNSDNSYAKRYALPFGGFASSSNEYQCPIGYKKYFAMKFDVITPAAGYKFAASFGSGNIYYCLQELYVKNMGIVLPRIQPSFNNTPDCSLREIEVKLEEKNSILETGSE